MCVSMFCRCTCGCVGGCDALRCMRASFPRSLYECMCMCVYVCVCESVLNARLGVKRIIRENNPRGSPSSSSSQKATNVLKVLRPSSTIIYTSRQLSDLFLKPKRSTRRIHIRRRSRRPSKINCK